jgi:16S rRNA (guanine966-N2)-methyltransferase
MALGAGKQAFDLVLLDPPYHGGRGRDGDRLHRLGWINAASWVALETAADEEPRVRGLPSTPNARWARRS